MTGDPYAGPAAHLDEDQLDTVLEALGDAAEYRWFAAQGHCRDCGRLSPARCADHARDEELSARYAALAYELREETGR